MAQSIADQIDEMYEAIPGYIAPYAGGTDLSLGADSQSGSQNGSGDLFGLPVWLWLVGAGALAVIFFSRN